MRPFARRKAHRENFFVFPPLSPIFSSHRYDFFPTRTAQNSLLFPILFKFVFFSTLSTFYAIFLSLTFLILSWALNSPWYFASLFKLASKSTNHIGTNRRWPAYSKVKDRKIALIKEGKDIEKIVWLFQRQGEIDSKEFQDKHLNK